VKTLAVSFATQDVEVLRRIITTMDGAGTKFPLHQIYQIISLVWKMESSRLVGNLHPIIFQSARDFYSVYHQQYMG
jgi:hypothetical protein